MQAPKPPSLAIGSVKLGISFAVRHAIPSVVSAIAPTLLFAVCHAVDGTGLASGGSSPLLGFVGEHYLEAFQAAAAVMIVVLTVRRVVRSAAAEASFELNLDWSWRNSLVRTAFRSSWIVFVLLGALYILLAVSGSVIAEGGPRNILLIPVYLVLMPLTTGGPLGLVIIYSLIAGGMFTLGFLAVWTVRSVLVESGADAAARIDVFRPILTRPFGLIRLVLNLAWLYGVPFILLYRWTPTLIFPPRVLPTFSQLERSSEPPQLADVARIAYEGGSIAIGLVLAALAAVIIWSRAATLALPVEPKTTTSVERTRPWHDPETPMAATLKTRVSRPGGSFGKRSAGP
jgi:hypothetical protein